MCLLFLVLFDVGLVCLLLFLCCFVLSVFVVCLCFPSRNIIVTCSAYTWLTLERRHDYLCVICCLRLFVFIDVNYSFVCLFCCCCVVVCCCLLLFVVCCWLCCCAFVC